MSLEFGLTPSGLFSLRLTFELSKSEGMRDVSVTRIGDTFPRGFPQTVFGTPCGYLKAFGSEIKQRWQKVMYDLWPYMLQESKSKAAKHHGKKFQGKPAASLSGIAH